MFITISTNLSGQYFIILADNSGPIERLDCCNFDSKDDAESFAIKLGKEYNVRVLL